MNKNVENKEAVLDGNGINEKSNIDQNSIVSEDKVNQKNKKLSFIKNLDKSLLNKSLAEALGSFLLVFGILFGSIILPFFMFSMPQQSSSGSTELNFAFYIKPLTIALSYGLSAWLVFVTLAKISGGHFNPVISIAAAICKRVSWVVAGIYIVAQLFGAVLATVVIRLILPSSTNGSSQSTDISLSPTSWFKYSAAGYDNASAGNSLYSDGLGFIFSPAAVLILELIGVIIITWVFISITE
ncbi:MAG: aquaporin, partial [Bifidobacteriaceae bacterium]|nr:aquaporin [Bifidobacteriaceae bacterium]